MLPPPLTFAYGIHTTGMKALPSFSPALYLVSIRFRQEVTAPTSRLPGTATGVLPGHILVSPPPSGHSPFHSIMVTWQPFRKHFGAELGLVHRQLDP